MAELDSTLVKGTEKWKVASSGLVFSLYVEREGGVTVCEIDPYGEIGSCDAENIANRIAALPELMRAAEWVLKEYRVDLEIALGGSQSPLINLKKAMDKAKV